MREELYRQLAACLEYPHPRWRRQLQECRRSEALNAVPGAADHLDRFLAAVDRLKTTDAQELFTRTFDHNPAHALEIGWHLFGEDYHRGALLVRLRRELRRHGVAESTELPDHLTHVLVLLGKMRPEEAAAFADACVQPALEKLEDGLKRGDWAYRHLIRCIVEVIEDSRERGFEEIRDGHSVHLS